MPRRIQRKGYAEIDAPETGRRPYPSVAQEGLNDVLSMEPGEGMGLTPAQYKQAVINSLTARGRHNR